MYYGKRLRNIRNIDLPEEEGSMSEHEEMENLRICIVSACTHTNDDPARTNLCGCHLTEFTRVMEKLKRKKHPRFYRKSWVKIIKNLSQNDVLQILGKGNI